MRIRCALIVFLLFLAAPLAAADRFDVRVLYCGDPGSDREADYRKFLEQHFSKVTLHDLREFKEKDADDQDVVIFDWSYAYNGKGDIDDAKWKRLRPPKLSKGFSRPAILVGRAGGAVAMNLKLKTNWLCLCLQGPAHHLALDHPLFHSPLKVDPKLEQVPTPGEYPYQTIDPALGPTMTVWNVQTKYYPDVDPGLVSGLYGFKDSPDAEVFAQGFALKGPDTVPLGRHANYFLWGFSAPPAEMTPAAKRLFVNAVCYMRQFDGKTALVRNESEAREWALRQAMIPRLLTEKYKQHEIRLQRAMLKNHPEWVPEKRKNDVDAFIQERVKETQKYDEEWMKDALPEPLRKEFGMDTEKYIAYYQKNFEYLRLVEGHHGFVVDEEAKAIGPSNRRLEFLDRCVSLLEKHERPELAIRLLKRYTSERFESASQWRSWLDANRGRLFFSDVGGYKYVVAPTATPARATTVSSRK